MLSHVPPAALAGLPTGLAASADVAVDPAIDLVTYTLAGFLDRALVQLVAEQQVAAAARLRCPPNQHLTMIDISACKIQSQDVVEAFRTILDDPRYRSRKLAVVVGSSLARMQMRRVLQRDVTAYVETRAEARAWLMREG